MSHQPARPAPWEVLLAKHQRRVAATCRAIERQSADQLWLRYRVRELQMKRREVRLALGGTVQPMVRLDFLYRQAWAEEKARTQEQAQRTAILRELVEQQAWKIRAQQEQEKKERANTLLLKRLFRHWLDQRKQRLRQFGYGNLCLLLLLASGLVLTRQLLDLSPC